MLGDMALAGITGLLLGSAISFVVVRGFWPPAGVLGSLLLGIHLVAIGLGQTVRVTRKRRTDLARIAAIYGAAVLVGLLAALVVLA